MCCQAAQTSRDAKGTAPASPRRVAPLPLPAARIDELFLAHAPAFAAEYDVPIEAAIVALSPIIPMKRLRTTASMAVFERMMLRPNDETSWRAPRGRWERADKASNQVLVDARAAA